jgi:magnesium chelatase family protein
VEVPRVDYGTLTEPTPGETSAVVRERVHRAHAIQSERFVGTSIRTNALMPPAMIRKHCALSRESLALLKQSFDALGLSARAHDRILKLARTIADLDGEENIKTAHVAEAIQYRSLDRKWW